MMTFEEMRAEMRRKVVPENVIPLNITEYLMDDSAELPELDAFTFLNRLRGLGIGSADFQYLLEGCGAPAECVEKIKNNPAMNLQNLILTLESSGMTSQDYTMILYTARQIWERTLTIRLEQTENAVEEERLEETPEENNAEAFEEPDAAEDIPNEEYRAPAKPNVAEEFYDAFSEDEGEDDDEEYGEPSLAEVLEQVKLLKEEMSYHGDEEESSDTSFEEEAEIAYEEEPAGSYEEYPGDRTVADFEFTRGFSKVFDMIKDKKAAEDPDSAVMSVTTILADMGKNPLEEESEIPVQEIYDIEEFEEDGDFDDGSLYDGDTTDFVKIDPEEVKKSLAFSSSEKREESENNDSEERQADEEEKPKKNYHIKRLTASAVGAAALAVLSFTAGAFGKKAPEIRFASENGDVFSSVYDSYSAGIIGGESVCGYSGEVAVFGDLLINNGGFTSFSDNSCVYTVSEDKISVQRISGTTLSESEIALPEKTSAAAVFELDNSLYCVFSGEEECGVMKIQNGAVLYTVRQDGKLCDFSADGEKIAFGSVYVPDYSKNLSPNDTERSFSADDTAVYLPRLGVGEKTPLTAENVALSGTDGISFAVCAEYSLADGNLLTAKAVLGNPVTASADFKAAFNGTAKDGEKYGLLLSYKDGLVSEKCGEITAAAFGDDFAVTVDGGAVNVRDESFTARSVLSNLPEQVEKLKIDGENLLAGNKDGFFSAFDCADAAAPAVLRLTKADGVFLGDEAALFNLNSGLEITYYKNENGALKILGRYSKTLTADELRTLRLRGTQTVVFAGDSCGAAYEYFDGVSVVSEYAVFGKSSAVKTLYDDRTGFTLAFSENGKIFAVCSEGAINIE